LKFAFRKVDGLVFQEIRDEFQNNCQNAGQWLPLRGLSGVTWGAAVATVNDLKKPLFVSPGHNVTLETSLNIVFAVSRYRQPDPIRQADQRSRKFIRDLKKK
jgi:deoxyinosine 3'endonuclease (endonuclease V)